MTLVCSISAVQAQFFGRRTCTVAQGNDALVGQTQLLGNRNISDSIWHDQIPFFRKYGAISKITAYKAYDYDGLNHDPGELKGFQFWYGPNQQPPIYKYEDGDANLMGARKPHVPADFELEAGELITKVELQWDIISMRYVKFTTNTGRTWDWGFPGVAGAYTAVSEAPVAGAYLAGMRGFEGKPRAGISKKRYLIQVAFVWALPTCLRATAAPAAPVVPYLSRAQMQAQAAQRLVSNIYQLDPESVALIPESVEASNIVYTGLAIDSPPEDIVVIVYVNRTTMITKAGAKGEDPPLGWQVYVPGVTPITPQDNPAEPKPKVVEEKTVAPVRAAPAAVPLPAPAPVERPVVAQQPVPAPAPAPVPVPVEAPPPARNFGIFGFLFGR
ncbi:hypothetical protein OEZ85_013919 [Tetradesmus obliquus]|uniref:Uncharacterized protein n=1 Tax=Tetradesmus obliquus TaxID=3088 RepID=A0ABY8U6J0_TETOB|nr:hypothetical protein OEZ85_013919 [Tetradesmus obliquus]